MIKAVAFQTIFAWILATAVYQIGSRIENGTFNFPNLLVISIITAIVILILKGDEENKEDECRKCPYVTSCKK